MSSCSPKTRLARAWISILLFLSACMPLSAPPGAPANIPATLPAVEPTFTPLPTLTPLDRQPQLNSTPTPASQTVYGEPAGCLPAAEQAARTTEEMLAYADSLLTWSTPLARRKILNVWNAFRQAYAPTGEAVLAFSAGDVQNRYLIQEALDALHVAGFIAWLRADAKIGDHILAIPLRAGVLDGAWGGYVRAYFAGSAALPAEDPNVRAALKLTPCRWMVAAGLAPDLPPGALEGATWTQPDFAAAATAYLAPTDEAAYEVAKRIAWLDGRSEAPALMCGPLAWAITNDAGAFPPGYGAWFQAPKSFWLPKPSENGRPWSLFPPETYVLQRFKGPLGSFDLGIYPLQAGDLLYTYSSGDGFDHVLVVSEVDADGNRFAVTNLVQVSPESSVTIQRVLLYNEADPGAGILRNQWANDRVNGRTGDKAFEIFRWAWREKDVQGQPAAYIVQPGDTLPLVAARWRTPPALIASANRLDPASQLPIGQELMIPPNE